MSRCFPYTSLRVVKNGARGEALNQIEPMKLLNGEEKPVSAHIKETKRGNDGNRTKEKTHYPGEKYHPEGKVQFLKRRNDDDEKSDVSSEHGQPVFSNRVSFAYNSPSNKRKSEDSTSNDVKRNVVRIKFTGQKPQETKESVTVGQLCHGLQSKALPQLKQTISKPLQEISPISVLERIEEISPVPERVGNIACSAAVTSSTLSKKQRKAQRYKAITEDWVTPPLQFYHDDSDNQEWLFGTEVQKTKQKPSTACLEVSSCRDSISWPQAYYLPSVDMHALPYTVPF